jgi:hypothetical protein
VNKVKKFHREVGKSDAWKTILCVIAGRMHGVSWVKYSKMLLEEKIDNSDFNFSFNAW